MHIVVFVLRGCSAGWLGAYGNEWVATPNLDRFAAEGVVFDRHVSDCPEEAAFRRAVLTGRDQFRPPAEPAPGLLEHLREGRVFTAVLPAADAHPDQYAGWGKVFDAGPPDDEVAAPPVEKLRAVLADLAGRDGGFLSQVELGTLLPPWQVPAEVFEAYLEDLVEESGVDEPPIPWEDPQTGWFDADDAESWDLLRYSFAAVVSRLDAWLGAAFEAAGDAVCFVTADAGFPLGEHGIVGPHRPWLYEELVHVPLIVRFPDAAFAGTRVDAFTQPADLMPTLLALFGRPVPAGLDGHDLARYWRGEAAVRPHAVSVLSRDGASEAAIRTDAWAYLRPEAQHADDAHDPRAAALFVKPDDRCEVNDLAARDTEVVEQLEEELRKARGERRASAP